jgi:hypothetical protein
MNAKEEFLRHTKCTEGFSVLCAIIDYGHSCFYEEDEKAPESIILKKEYNSADYEAFLKLLDFEYDHGFGGQELFGVIWYTNGNWSNRSEYDGSEWWTYNRCPEIPKELS